MRKVIAVTMMALSFSVSAEVYKWTDENGVTHFGSQPPPGQRNEQIEVRAPEPGRRSPGQSSIVSQAEEMERERKIRRLEQEAERRERAQQQDSGESWACEYAKERVEEYEIDLRELGRKGYKQWEKDQVESWLEEAERDVERDCN